MIASIINVESSFNAEARSNKNALGLMQIKLETANYINKLNGLNIISENELNNAEQKNALIHPMG